MASMPQDAAISAIAGHGSEVAAMWRVRRLAWALAFAAGSLLSAEAGAQTQEATRAAARQLATEGIDDFEQGEFVVASGKLNRAFQTIRAPSLGLWSARALARCGRLVQASERYLEVLRLDPNNGDESVQRAAQDEAAREHQELQPRLPRLALALFGTVPDLELTVTLDGARLPSALLRAQVPVDPGEHVIVAQQGDARASQTLRVAEGARVNVSLQLLLPNRAPPAPARRELPPPGADRRAPRTALWLTLAGSGAALAVGGATGLLAVGTRAELSPRCPGNVCSAADAASVERLSTLRTVSTLSFALGGLGLGAAGVLWLASPPRSPHDRASVRTRLGLAQVALEGDF